MTDRSFPPPWTVEKMPGGLVMRGALKPRLWKEGPMCMRIVIMAIMLALVGESAFSQQLVRSYELAAHCKMVDSFCEAYLGGYIDAAELYQLWITTHPCRIISLHSAPHR